MQTVRSDIWAAQVDIRICYKHQETWNRADTNEIDCSEHYKHYKQEARQGIEDKLSGRQVKARIRGTGIGDTTWTHKSVGRLRTEPVTRRDTLPAGSRL